MLLLGLAGYHLQSRKRPRADNLDTENTEKKSRQDLAKSRSPLDTIVGSLAFMLVVVPTGFMRDLVVDTRVDRVHHILERLTFAGKFSHIPIKSKPAIGSLKALRNKP